MTKVLVFGQLKIMRENPWAKVGKSTKTHYLANPQPWVIDKNRASEAQKAVWDDFTEIAKKSIEVYPADGSFATLQKRVEWIGKQMRELDKVYTTKERLLKRAPKSITEGHPLMEKFRKLGVSYEEVKRAVAAR